MTALSYNVSSPPQDATVTSTVRLPSDNQSAQRRPPLMKKHRPIRSLSTSSGCTLKSKSSSVLTKIRRNYTSRGLSTSRRHLATPSNKKQQRKNNLPAVVSNVCDIKNENTAPPTSDISSLSQEEPTVTIESARRTVSLLKLNTFAANGNDDDDEADDECGSCSDSNVDLLSSQDDNNVDCNNNNNNRKYRIQFGCYVKEVEIPHRNSYSITERMQMWNNNETLRIMMKRNRIEYDWEGNDWEHAPEEDEFCYINGVQLHPAHLI